MPTCFTNLGAEWSVFVAVGIWLLRIEGINIGPEIEVIVEIESGHLLNSENLAPLSFVEAFLLNI